MNAPSDSSRPNSLLWQHNWQAGLLFHLEGNFHFSVYANMLLLDSCIARLVSVWCWSAWISGPTKIRSRSALTLRSPSAASSSGVSGDCCRGTNMTTHSLSRETHKHDSEMMRCSVRAAIWTFFPFFTQRCGFWWFHCRASQHQRNVHLLLWSCQWGKCASLIIKDHICVQIETLNGNRWGLGDINYNSTPLLSSGPQHKLDMGGLYYCTRDGSQPGLVPWHWKLFLWLLKNKKRLHHVWEHWVSSAFHMHRNSSPHFS